MSTNSRHENNNEKAKQADDYVTFESILQGVAGDLQKEVFRGLKSFAGATASKSAHSALDNLFNSVDKFADQAYSTVKDAANTVMSTDLGSLFDSDTSSTADAGMNKFKDTVLAPQVKAMNTAAVKKLEEWMNSDSYQNDLAGASSMAGDVRFREAYRKLTEERLNSITVDDVLANLPETE